MKGLYPLWREMALRWWRWALAEVHPLHPDVPSIIRRVREAAEAIPPVPDCESVQGLLISGWFYAAGLLCIAGASGLLWLAYLLWWTK